MRHAAIAECYLAAPKPAPIAAAPVVHIPPRVDRPAPAPRPLRASNTTGWKPPVPPTRRGANDQTSPKPKLPLVAEPTGTDIKRLARGTEAPPAIDAAAKPPRLTLVSTQPRPLPPPVDDDNTHVDLVKVKAAAPRNDDDSRSPTPSPSLPRLSARR